MYYRKLNKAPINLVENWKINYGCYHNAIEHINFTDAQNIWNTNAPLFLKKFRLKEWQAFQFWHKSWFAFGAVYNAKILGVSILSLYNFRTGEKFHTLKTTLPWQQKVATGLQHSQSAYASSNQKITIKNQLDIKRFGISAENVTHEIQLQLLAYHTTEPIVSVIPFEKNRAMYSHKAIMPCEGNLQLGTQKLNFSRNDSLLMLDDHKGFYPYRLKYNWVTAAWHNSDGNFFAFNLTQNQSVDPEIFNENCFWVNGLIQTLPPVTFKVAGKKWVIKDKYGLVDLEFMVQSENYLQLNLGIVSSDYRAPYGTFSGTLKSAKHTLRLNKVQGMGEIKRNKM